MTTLDDPSLLELDASGMLRHISDTGPELVRAWERCEDLVLPAGAETATSVVLAGVGGSATAADYFAAICAPYAEIPVSVVRGYTLPNHVNDRTLVVVLSYSGNTDETLSCYDDAWKRGAKLLALTRGGRMRRRAGEDGTPWHEVSYESPPRAATVHSLAPLLRMGHRLGLCNVDTRAIKKAAKLHARLVEDIEPSMPVARNGAKQIADGLQGRLPFIFGAEHLAPAATRFRNQLAENGKAFGAAESLPEANHNLIVGLETARHLSHVLAAVQVESRTLNSTPVLKRFDVTAQMLKECGVPVFRIDLGGATVLEQLLQATAWGDFVSFYVALLHGVDPTPIPQIERARAAIANAPLQVV